MGCAEVISVSNVTDVILAFDELDAANAYLPMLTVRDGSEMLVMPLPTNTPVLLDASSVPIESPSLPPDSNVTAVTFAHLLNALSAIEVTVLGIIMGFSELLLLATGHRTSVAKFPAASV